MGRVRVQAYGASNSAKELARYLGVKRLLTNGRSRFRGRVGDVIINWGNVKNKLSNVQYVNPIDSISIASNKLSTLNKLNEYGVNIPNYYTNYNSVPDGQLIVARELLSGHSGRGISVGFKDAGELPRHCGLYTEYIDKVAEYRAIVVNGKVVDFKQKKKRASARDEEGNVIEDTRIEHNEHIWNLDGGYVMCRDNIEHPEEADVQAIKAMEAVGLIYGAVDLIKNSEGDIYVLEINTAFGLEGSTIQLVGDAIKEYINEIHIRR